MDRAWMYEKRGPDFIVHLMTFIDAAKKHAATKKTKDICCPCHHCANKKVWSSPNAIQRHLIQCGFVKDYLIWTHHGEERVNEDVNVASEVTGGLVDDDDT